MKVVETLKLNAIQKKAKTDPAAQYAMAVYYLVLASTKTDDQEQDSLRNIALGWLLKSSQNNYSWANLALAELSYLRGHVNEALDWYGKFSEIYKLGAKLPEKTLNFDVTGKLALSEYANAMLKGTSKYKTPETLDQSLNTESSVSTAYKSIQIL